MVDYEVLGNEIRAHYRENSGFVVNCIIFDNTTFITCFSVLRTLYQYKSVH